MYDQKIYLTGAASLLALESFLTSAGFLLLWPLFVSNVALESWDASSLVPSNPEYAESLFFFVLFACSLQENSRQADPKIRIEKRFFIKIKFEFLY